jgi:hypothetical protein
MLGGVMKNWLAGLLCLVLSGAAVASGPGGVRKRVQASMVLTGTIVVAPDGSVRGYVIDHADKIEPQAMALISGTIPTWKFEQVLRGGHAVVAKAKMSLRVVAKPVGDGNYALSINGTHFGQNGPGEDISYKDRAQPIYPAQALRGRVAGTVYLVLRVGRQGQVEDAAAEQVNLAVVASDQALTQWRTILAKSALVAARKWTFNIPVSGEHHNEAYWIARVPVNYSLAIPGQPRVDNYGTWQSYVPGPKELVPWIEDKRLLSGSPDALPGDGLYPLDQHGLHLMTALSGA